MEITYLGQSCFRLKGKSVVVVTDPYADAVGRLPKDLSADVVTVSHNHADHNAVEKVKLVKMVIDCPGEYETGGVSVIGWHTWHDDKKGAERGGNTMFMFEIEGLRICHAGDLGHKLDQKMLDEMGPVDIAMVPVGGYYTIDAAAAAEVVKQLDPWIVIPMHYGGDKPGKLAPVADFLREMGVSGVVPAPRYTVIAEKLPPELTVVVLERKG